MWVNLPLIPIVVVLLVAFIGALSGGFFSERKSNNDSTIIAAPSVNVISGIQNGAIINSSAAIDNPDASVYGHLALADVSNSSLVGFSNPSGKILKSEAQFLNYSSNQSTSSILEAIAFKFNVPIQALQNLTGVGN